MQYVGRVLKNLTHMKGGGGWLDERVSKCVADADVDPDPTFKSHTASESSLRSVILFV